MAGGGRPRDWPPNPATTPEVSTDPPAPKPATTAQVSTDSTALARPGRAPRASTCEPYRELIVEAVGRGRNAMAIWQDLVDDHGFPGRYASVRRYVATLRTRPAVEVRVVITTSPGEEGQVDYGEGPMVRHPDTGKYRRTRLFVLTLGYSRKAVRFLVWRSSTLIWAELHGGFSATTPSSVSGTCANLIEGHGLVFNPGERVEGYTNFLWVLELAALWGALGLRPEHAAPWLSVACTAATIGVVLWWVIRIPGLQQRRLISWVALGSAVQQCDLRRLDFRWRVGNTTVHVVCCSGHRLCHGARR